ncbi:MAG: hypothetical protein P8Y02_12370 [Deinococcales bacterium]
MSDIGSANARMGHRPTRSGLRVDTEWNGVIRWGGLSLFGAGAILILFVALVFGLGQALPVTARLVLEDPTLPSLLFELAAIGELLLMPAVLGLYHLLKSLNRTAIFLATSLWLLSVPLFLASRAMIIATSQLSGPYAASNDAAARASYLATAELAIQAQSILSAMGLTLLSLATILLGVVLLKGALGRALAVLVLASGIFTVSSAYQVLLGIPIVIPFIGLVLSAIWQVFVGARMVSLTRST